MRTALAATAIACLALAGCGDTGAGGTPSPGPPDVAAKVSLDRTIESLDGTDVHLTQASTRESIPGVKLDKTKEWIVISMTVTPEKDLAGKDIRPDMSIIGGNGDDPDNAAAEKALPDGLEKAQLPKGKPTKASVVFAIDRARVKGAQFNYAGENVALGL